MSSLQELEKIVNTIRDELRVLGITGEESINHCIFFFLYRMMTPSLLKECEISEDKSFDNVIKWYDKFERESGEIEVYEDIFSGEDSFIRQFKLNVGFRNLIFKIKDTKRLKKILYLMKDVDVAKLEKDVDIIGTIYEFHLKTGTGNARDVGQFFTDRKVINHMVSLCDPKVKDGKIESLLDPTCGSGGFLVSAIKYLRGKEEKIDWEINKDRIHGCDVDEKSKDMTTINLFMELGKKIENIELGNSLKGVEKADIILANPPFGIKGIKWEDCCEEIRRLGIKGNKAEVLFLQLIMVSLNKGGRCAVIVPDGVLFNDNKFYRETREYLLSNFNVKKIISMETGFFLNTNVKTSILFFCNDGETKNVEFSKIIMKDGKIEEEKGEIVSIEKIEEENYSLQLTRYVKEEKKEVKYNLEYKRLGDLVENKVVKKRKSKEGSESGLYPLYYCSIKGYKYLDEYDVDDEGIMINTTNGSGKCEVFYNKGKYSVAENTMRLQKLKGANCCLLYIYVYLKNNKEVIERLFRGTNQKQLNKNDFFDLLIPIPSLKTQEEVARKLENLYNLKKNINDTIEQLKNKQKYIIETETKNVEKKEKIGDIAELKKGKIASSKVEEGEYKFISLKDGTCNSYSLDGENVFIASVSAGLSSGPFKTKIKYYHGKCTPSTLISQLILNESVNKKYIFYYLTYIKEIIELKCEKGACNKTLDKEMFYKLEIPIPSLQKQEELVKRLNTIETTIEMLEKQQEDNDNIAKTLLEQALQSETKTKKKKFVIIDKPQEIKSIIPEMDEKTRERHGGISFAQYKTHAISEASKIDRQYYTNIETVDKLKENLKNIKGENAQYVYTEILKIAYKTAYWQKKDFYTSLLKSLVASLKECRERFKNKENCEYEKGLIYISCLFDDPKLISSTIEAFKDSYDDDYKYIDEPSFYINGFVMCCDLLLEKSLIYIFKNRHKDCKVFVFQQIINSYSKISEETTKQVK